MAQRKYYYTLKEAQQLKQRFSWWINRTAHLGKGEVSILQEIAILPRKTLFVQPPENQTFYLEFRFINSRKIDLSHFISCNEPETFCQAHLFMHPHLGGISKNR